MTIPLDKGYGSFSELKLFLSVWFTGIRQLANARRKHSGPLVSDFLKLLNRLKDTGLVINGIGELLYSSVAARR